MFVFVFSVFFCGGLWDEGVILGIQGLCGVREFYLYDGVCISALLTVNVTMRWG